MKKIVLLLSVLALSLFTSCQKKVDEETIKGLCYDIEYIQIDLQNAACKELYDPAPFEELKAEIKTGTVDTEECISRLQKIIHGYNVIHLNLYRNQEHVAYYGQKIPFIFLRYGNEYRIVFSTKKYKKYLGWKLAGVGDYTVEQVRDKLADYRPFETETGKKFVIGRQYYNDYKQAGLLEKNGKIRFKFQNDSGNEDEVIIKIVDTINPQLIHLSSEIRVPDLPSYNVNAGCNNYFLSFCPEIKTIYVHYESCESLYDYNFSSLIDDLMNELHRNDYKTIVWDVRKNGGGLLYDMNLLHMLLYSNKEELEKYNQAVVFGGNTYSAAVDFIDRFLTTFPNAVLFGEESGQAIDNFTCVYPYELKHLKCMFSYPTSMDDTPTLHEKFNDTSRGVIPDVQVLDDYNILFTGKDAAYLAVEEYFKSE